MLVSATYLHAKSPAAWLTLFRVGNAVSTEAIHSPGVLGGKIRADRRGDFWTITGWESRDAMLGFKNAPAHGKAMPRLDEVASHAMILTWEADALPSWAEAAAVLRETDPRVPPRPAAGISRAVRPARRTRPTAP
jgi:hypothetical protein